MPKKVTNWECVHCGQVHDTKEEAIICEEKCEEEKDLKTQRKERAFPAYHKNDSHIKMHCVHCGQKLIEYELMGWGGRGREIFRAKDIKIFRNGIYCSGCFAKNKDKEIDV